MGKVCQRKTGICWKIILKWINVGSRLKWLKILSSSGFLWFCNPGSELLGPWDAFRTYEVASKSFRTESITKYTLTFGITRCCPPFQRVMAAKLTGLTHKIAIQLHLVTESCTICSPRSWRPVWKLLDTPSHSFRYSFGPDVYHAFVFSIFSNIPGSYLKIGQERFLPHPCRFIAQNHPTVQYWK
jgi:hypothetical protein